MGAVIDALFIAILTSSLTVFVFDLAANPNRGKKVSEIFFFLYRAGTTVQDCGGRRFFFQHFEKRNFFCGVKIFISWSFSQQRNFDVSTVSRHCHSTHHDTQARSNFMSILN